ncbi:cysteine hydrolase family protein [Chloroflexota bacterium]
MTNQLLIERDKTAVLLMDYQNDIVGAYPETLQNELLAKASAVLAEARHQGIPIIYVVVRFREGYPEISAQDVARRGIKETGRLMEGTQGAEILPAVAPQPQEVVVTKRRTGPFSTTDLTAVLNARGINTLVLMGVATSGCVLTTVRWAADIDYHLIVLADCCADRDEEVHRVLTEKVFPRQATVITSREFLQAMGEV